MAASKPMTFDSQIKVVNTFGQDCSVGMIKTEPMFFNSDFDYAMKNGGFITKAFLNALPMEWKSAPLVFDSRIHMLMPGWYPAIPGWHHDDVPRPKIPVGQHFASSGQPDYDNPRYKAEHIMGLINGDVCPTAFAIGKCTMPAISEGELIYRAWHKEVERLIRDEQLSIEYAKSGQLVYFDCDTFHTGVKTVSNGWRWFGRVSRNTDRVNEITNEIRCNAQVYLEFPMEGW